MKRRSAPPHGPLRLGKGLYYYIIQYTHDSSRVVVQLSIFETRKSLCFFLEVGSVAGLGCSTHQGGQRAVYDVDVWLWFSELIDETRNPHPAARANNTAPSNNATINISNNATAWSPLVSFSLSLSLSLSRFLYEDWLTVRVWNWVLNSKKLVNGSRYHRALESVSIASALSSALAIYPCQIQVYQTLTVLNSNFLQLGRRTGGWPATADSLPQAVTYQLWVIHTTLAGIEPTTFQLLVRRATSRATESHRLLLIIPVDCQNPNDTWTTFTLKQRFQGELEVVFLYVAVWFSFWFII